MDRSDRVRGSLVEVVEPPSRRGFAAPGTTFMVAGGLIGAVGAYLFQIYGGRSIGEEAFAPVGLLWTIFFILTTVLLIPLEQYVTREVAAGRKSLPSHLRYAGLMALIGAVLGGAYVWANLDRAFDGDTSYIVQIVLLMVGYSLLVLAKGVFAGHRRFAGVGWILIIESLVRLAAGVVAVSYVSKATSLGWAMVLGGFSVLALRWWKHDSGAQGPPSAPFSGFMGGYVAGTASSQVLLGGAPIAVDLLGAPEAVVSSIFFTFILYRAPMTLIFGLQGRILPFLYTLSGSGDSDRLKRIGRMIFVGGTFLALVGAAVGYLVGPAVVEVLVGAEFAPTAVVALFAAGGVMAAAAAQVLSQVLVAEARTSRVAVAWWGGLIAAMATLLISRGDPALRVAMSFAFGEGVALLLMSVLSGRLDGSPS